jgi:hypothetical protein
MTPTDPGYSECYLSPREIIDAVVHQAAIELGWHAAKDVSCSCALRSFWEGQCDWCCEHPAPPEPPKTFEEYVAYAEFEVDKEFHILPMPPLPPEAWAFIKEMEDMAQELSYAPRNYSGGIDASTELLP